MRRRPRSTPSSTSRTSRRTPRRDRSRWPGSATSPRSFAPRTTSSNALQAGVTVDLKTAVTSVNGLTRQIADLNQQIASMQGNGHDPNDLLDKRDIAINELSKYLQVSTIAADDGSLSVFMNGGQRLVLGGQATTLAAVPGRLRPGEGAARHHRGRTDAHIAARLRDRRIGGRAAALPELRPSGCPQPARPDGGCDQRPPEPAAGARPRPRPAARQRRAAAVGRRRPASRRHRRTRRRAASPVASYINGSGVRVPSVSLTIVDTDALRASDYELRSDPADPAGTYRLTRLSDGIVAERRQRRGRRRLPGRRRDSAAGRRATASCCSRSHRRSRNIRRVLDDPAGIAAASPVTATVANANTGTAAVASLSAVSPSLNPNLTATITFTDDAGGYSYSLVDTTGALPTTIGHRHVDRRPAGQAQRLVARAERRPAQRRRRSACRRPRFRPATTATRTRCSALRDVPFVGQQTLAGGVIQPGDTVTDAYAAALAKVGVRVQSAKLSADQSASIAADAKMAQSLDDRREPRRGSRAPDPVPAELPGRRPDAAGRAVAVRHAAAGRRLNVPSYSSESSPCASRLPTPSTPASTP